MDAQKINMLELISTGKRTFSIPVYQRNYDWKVNNCRRLFNDIEKIAIDEERESHFLGTIVYVDGKRTANFREFIVIDGQQRLTSVMLLLKAISVKTSDKAVKDEIVETYLTNKRCPEELRIKLKPIKNDAVAYDKIINDDQLENKDINIIRNYFLFLDLIDDSKLTPEQLYDGMNKLEIVYISLDGEKENPQLIFESLNSTGLDLTQADLIRNYLLMGQRYDIQEMLYTKYWTRIEQLLPDAIISDFIRDYLILKYNKIPNKEKVYECFKLYYETLHNYTAEGFLDELLTFAQYYSWFRYYNSPYPNINEKLEELGRLKSTVAYPFLLNVFEDSFMYKKYSVDDICNVLELIISYVLRRLVCDLPTNALNKVFYSLPREIDKNKNDNLTIFDKVAISLLNKKGKSAFPNDAMIKEYIFTKDFYAFKQCKYFLYKIECDGSKEVIDEANLTIEHIMPQKLSPRWQVDLGKKYNEIHEKYLHRIGNLTLSADNSELSNKDFTTKKEILQRSKLKLNRALLEYNEWNENSIVDRSEKLFNETIKIWKYPIDDYKTYMEESINKTEYDIMEEVNVTNRDVYQITILGEEISINSWREFFRTVCTKMFEYDPQIFKSLIRHKDFKGRSKKIIDDNHDNMIRPYPITDEIYIEQNLSANDSLNYSKLVIEKYEGMENEVTYKIR